ncbi:MAG: glycoside hydrolase family 127 protein [Armatimonadetes bacterium]|nr:glycoside hydrolase family 127 protein [Armatimonadota bacterium]
MTEERIVAREQRAFEPVVRTQWRDGVIGKAVESSFQHRLCHFVTGAECEAIQMFSPESRAFNDSGDWYGEHAGKWLVASALAYRRTQSDDIKARILGVVDALVEFQARDGSLSTYAAGSKARLSHSEADSVRSWDIWVHAWLALGFLAVAEHCQSKTALAAAEKIGDLLVQTFGSDPARLLSIGNHSGLSSAVVIEPLARLSLGTGDPKYSELAQGIVSAMELRGLPILSGPTSGIDVSELGTGKCYQICWILTGLTVLYRCTGDESILNACLGWWANIRDHHLTPLGGPWGGIATHKEVFNPRGFFSPYGMTETCATASWMALNRELFLLTANAEHVDHFERSLYNALLGAMDADGENWCYFTFPNGRRNNTYYWACCKSSGAMALEEAAQMAIVASNSGLSINLFEPSESAVNVGEQDCVISLKSTPDNPFAWTVQVELQKPQEFAITVRKPAWAESIRLSANEVDVDESRIHREWRTGDTISIRLETKIQVHHATDSLDHHGQEIVRAEYVHFSLGPYVYASSTIDGYKFEETLRIAKLFPESCVVLDPNQQPKITPSLLFPRAGQASIELKPYFEAGRQHDGGWRTTWHRVAWQ